MSHKFEDSDGMILDLRRGFDTYQLPDRKLTEAEQKEQDRLEALADKLLKEAE